MALVTNSIGMPLTTTGSNDVVFLVLKCMRSSLHFVSLGGLDVTVLVLAYSLREGGIVDVFPEISGRNFKLVDHDDEHHGPNLVPWGTPAGTTSHSEKQSWPS